MRMAATTGATEVWQARIGHDLAATLRADSEVLGLHGRTEIVKAALELLHRQAAEQRMALSVKPLNARLGHVAVVPITATSGPALTHVPLTADAGLTRYGESYADITALQPVARGRLLRRRGLLARAELARMEDLIRTYLGV